MGTLKENFYKKLNSDFKAELKNSAIFSYLDEESSITADNYNGSGKLSPMARLKYYNRLVNSKKITVYEYICELINLLAAKSQLYTFNDLDNFDKTESKKINNLNSINNYIVPFLCCTTNTKPAPITKKSEAVNLAKAMAEKIKTTDMSEAFMKSKYNNPMRPPLKSLYDYLLDCAFIFEAKAFFYDATNRKNTHNNSARVDKSLLLLEKYFKKSDFDPFSDDFNFNFNSANIIDSDDFEDNCKILISIMRNDIRNKTSYENAFIPLYRDQITGCTFAIVGKNYFVNLYENKTPDIKRAFKDYAKKCPIVFSALDFTVETPKGTDKIGNDNQSLLTNDKLLPTSFSIKTHFNKNYTYEKVLDKFKKLNNNRLQENQKNFNPILPEGTPDCFKKCFHPNTSVNITDENTNEIYKTPVDKSLTKSSIFKKRL